jgi:hypothetical protein
MERNTRQLIRSMDLEGAAAQKLLVAQALAGARALDEALAAGRPLSAAQRMHERAVKALQATVAPLPPEDDAKDDDPDDVLLWVKAMHRPTIRCQQAFPVVTPGECGACDAAAEARVQYGREHPDVPGHGYGMSRGECGCAECLPELAAAQDRQ